MEKYNRILMGLRALFPHSTDVRVEVDTNEQDVKVFTDDILELSKTTFFIETGVKPPNMYSAYRSPFGQIKLNKNKLDGE